MDTTEELVYQYLRSSGFCDIVYEPDGNVPPDFLINQHIAVEVRRLNQNVVATTNQHQGLEEVFIPFVQRLKKYLPSLGSNIGGESWYVNVEISRPLEAWSFIETQILELLNLFKRSAKRRAIRLKVTDHLVFDLIRTGRAYPSFFVIGACDDADSGGWVVSELHKNLAICAKEKEQKIAPVRDRYSEWWLILTDYIGYDLDEPSKKQLMNMPPITHTWKKIILVNPLMPSQGTHYMPDSF